MSRRVIEIIITRTEADRCVEIGIGPEENVLNRFRYLGINLRGFDDPRLTYQHNGEGGESTATAFLITFEGEI